MHVVQRAFKEPKINQLNIKLNIMIEKQKAYLTIMILTIIKI